MRVSTWMKNSSLENEISYQPLKVNMPSWFPPWTFLQCNTLSFAHCSLLITYSFALSLFNYICKIYSRDQHAVVSPIWTALACIFITIFRLHRGIWNFNDFHISYFVGKLQYGIYLNIKGGWNLCVDGAWKMFLPRWMSLLKRMKSIVKVITKKCIFEIEFYPP